MAAGLFDFSRNHYDRLGHFDQGFVPVIMVGEVQLRISSLRPGKWFFFLITSVCLVVSACYEFAKWRAESLGGEASEVFLGTQGDQRDIQGYVPCIFRRYDRPAFSRSPA